MIVSEYKDAEILEVRKAFREEGEGDGEVSGQILEPQEVTLKDLYNMCIELSETNN